MRKKTTMGRVRKGKRRSPESGFIVTWDVDSADRPTTARVHRFVYGDVVRANGKVYRYPGSVEREGVRYLDRSVLLVRPGLLTEIEAFLSSMRIDHEATPASVG